MFSLPYALAALVTAVVLANMAMLNQMSTDIAAVRTEMGEGFSAVRAEMAEGFGAQANFERARIALAQNIWCKYFPSGCADVMTAHLIEIDDVRVAITASHAHCNGTEPLEAITCAD